MHFAERAAHEAAFLRGDEHRLAVEPAVADHHPVVELLRQVEQRQVRVTRSAGPRNSRKLPASSSPSMRCRADASYQLAAFATNAGVSGVSRVSWIASFIMRPLDCPHGLREPQRHHVGPGTAVVDRQLQAARRAPLDEIRDDGLPHRAEPDRRRADVDLAFVARQHAFDEYFEIAGCHHADERRGLLVLRARAVKR